MYQRKNFISVGLTNVDRMLDSPTDDVTNGMGNYCTWNPLAKHSGASLADGNLRGVTGGAGTSNSGVLADWALPEAGKWYWEIKMTDAVLCQPGIVTGAYKWWDSVPDNSEVYTYRPNGNKVHAGESGYGASFTQNDIVGIKWDADSGTLEFLKNDVSQGNAWTGLTGVFFPAIIRESDNGVGYAYFGGEGFNYTIPAGYLPLCTANLPAPSDAKADLSQHFAVVAYTGNGTAIGSGGDAVTGVGFMSSVIWVKNRDQADSHVVFNVPRGTNRLVETDSTDAEEVNFETFSTLSNDGLTVGNDHRVNASGEDYVAWCWKGNGTSSASSNTDGSITSTVSVDTSLGFSVVNWTGIGTTGTIGHGLGAVPGLVIAKRLDTAADWRVYHSVLGGTKFMELNNANAPMIQSDVWNDTAPTSSTLTVGTNGGVNANGGTYMACCFAPSTYISIGSYTGNGSADGPMVTCINGDGVPIRPQLVLIKGTGAGHSWWVFDVVRETDGNPMSKYLNLDSNSAENTLTAIDIVSMGFKVREAGGPWGQGNSSDTEYTYMAIGTPVTGTSKSDQVRAR